MTLPSKTSRPIEVNGRQYRWMTRRVKAPTRLRLTVEDQETREVQQKDYLPLCEDDGRLTFEEITPAKVKEVILYRFDQPA